MRKLEKKFGKQRFLKKYDSLKYGWLNDIKKFILLLAVLLFIFHSVVGFSFVKGYSMQPTLMEGDLVLYTRLNLSYQRGDIVSVKIPSGEYYVKRIIAMEGDTVELKDGKVYVNGQLISEPYLNVELTEEDSGIVRYPYTLQEGQIFIMGDNRPESTDSRNFGAVGKRQIKGKIWFRISRTY